MQKDKKFFLCMVLFCLFWLAAGCGRQIPADAPAASDMGLALKEVVQFEDGVELNQKKFASLYGLDEEAQDFYVIVAADNVQSDELAIIQAKDGEIDQVKEKVKVHIESQKASFKDYLPKEYDNLEQAQFITKGNYVFFCAGPNAAAAAEAFLAYFK